GGVLADDPAADRLHHVLLFRGVEGAAGGDVVPAVQAGAAAGGGGVLGDEDRVAAVGGLAAVVAGFGGGEPALDQFAGVLADGGHAAQVDDRAVAAAEPELRAEVMLPYAVQPGIQLVHQSGSRCSILR